MSEISEKSEKKVEYLELIYDLICFFCILSQRERRKLGKSLYTISYCMGFDTAEHSCSISDRISQS